MHAGLSQEAVARQPLTGCAHAHAACPGGIFGTQTLHENTLGQQGSISRRQAGMFI